MGLASLFMVACDNTPKQEQKPEEPQQEAIAQEEHHCPFCTLKAEYANWDNMDEAARVELNNKAIALFAELDAEMEAKKAECEQKCQHEGEHQCQHEGEHQCQHEGEHQCQHGMPELTEEQKAECEAKCAEMKAVMDQWANIETLTNDEQKDLILSRIAAMGMGEGKCGNHEGEKHECNHEGEGHQCQHEGEGHRCQHAE